MPNPLRKQNIPWLLSALRALLGPTVIACQAVQCSGLGIAALIVTALVSDIYDGVLARRWHCDTSAVRLFDSMADTVFYLCTAFALYRSDPGLIHRHSVLLATLLALEATRFAFDLAKFRKPASYHSYLAKTWGLVLAATIVTAFATRGHADLMIVLALALGIACDLEGLTMSLLLPIWHKDVKTLRRAWQLRTQDSSSFTMHKSRKPHNATVVGPSRI